MSHEMSSIRNLTANNHTNGVINIEDTSMSAWYKKFGEDLFFSSKDNAILALDSNNGPE